MYNIAIMDCTRLTRDIDMAILSVRPSVTFVRPLYVKMPYL